ncbi:MAG: hypothetical protein JJ858_10645 [Rhizobiaceae bacterium]|nr:hypothetical protein [Rhizobiaceae bacterium]
MVKLVKTFLYSSVAFTLLSGVTHSQERRLFYDQISTVEEPLATQIGDTTFSLRGSVELPTQISSTTKKVEIGFRGAFEVKAETQLENSLKVAASYAAEYDHLNADPFTDKVILSASGFLGSLYVGNVSDMLRENLARKSGVGNAALAYDSNWGQLGRWSAAHLSRHGPFRTGLAIDQNGKFELGFVFQRPVQTLEHKYSLRLTHGEFKPSGTANSFDTLSAEGVAELIYGSSTFSLSAGVERLKGPMTNGDRWFVSGGAQTKIGVISLSADAQYGQLNNQGAMSAALGARYDFARGASLNLGVNYKNADVLLDGVQLRKDDNVVEGVFSLRYDF